MHSIQRDLLLHKFHIRILQQKIARVNKKSKICSFFILDKKEALIQRASKRRRNHRYQPFQE